MDRSPTCHWWPVAAAAVLLLGVLVGCNQDGDDLDLVPNRTDSEEESAPQPPEVKGTVAEVATMISGGNIPVSSWGVVVGLDRNGSSEVPPQLQADLTKYLKGRIGIARPTLQTGMVSVADFLADPDTAVVRIDAVIPVGAPKGTRLDVVVSAWPRTQTTSLAGGMLLQRDLSWANPPGGTSGRYLKPLARAEGAIFVNPFLDPEDPKDATRFRSGRVLGGAEVIRNMPIRLQLRQPDYLTSNILQKRINFRFGQEGRKPIAKAKTSYFVELTVPPEWKNRYAHFLRLILHLPLRGGAHEDARTANRIAREMEKPTANHDELALVWEAMGKQIVPTVQKFYGSDIPAVAFYAARAGFRLGDEHLAGPVLLRFASTGGSQFQLPAVEELGQKPAYLEAGPVLRKLLDAQSELVRIAAYGALVERGSFHAVTRHPVDEGYYENDRPSFTADVVDTRGAFVIYATRTLEPRLVLFGRNMPIASPVFFESSDGLITLYNKPADPDAENPVAQQPHLVVSRKLSDGSMSKKFAVPFKVLPLIEVLGSRPRPDLHGNIDGLGLTYSQVVGVLQQLCRQNVIQAKFVLQPLSNIHTIYRMTPSMGRPDQPER